MSELSPMTLFQLAQRFVGEIAERPGSADNPFIVWCQESCNLTNTADEVPWCSTFLNRLCWLLRAARSKSARARSWLGIGVTTTLAEATADWCIVVLTRGRGPHPNATVLDAPGHVGLFAGLEDESVLILGGNQSNGVTIQRFPVAAVLGVRRLI